jgi:predicted MFS family arabinose efflux permease
MMLYDAVSSMNKSKSVNEYKMSRHDRRRSMFLAIVVSIGSIVAVTCGAGNILSLAAIKLGAGEMFLGIFSFVSSAPFVLTFLTMSKIETSGKIRILLLWYSVAALFMVPILFLPLVAGLWPVWACLALLAVSNAARNGAMGLGSTGWFPLLQDIVPRRYTGRFFARIRTSWQTANLICLIAAALILGSQPGWGRFEVLFILALLGQISMALPISAMVEKPPLLQEASPPSIYERIMDFLGQKTIRHYTLYVIVYMLAACAMEPFKLKLLSDLGYSYGFILAATAMVGVGAVISLRFWGTLADKFGNRAIFSISHVGMLLATAAWVFVGKSSAAGMTLVMLLYLFWSAFNSGNTIAQTNYMLRAVPPHKQNYMNFILLAQRLATAIAPFLAGLFLNFTKNLHIDIPNVVHIGSYDMLFLANAVAFAIPHLMRKPLKAQTDLPTSHVLTLVARPILDTIVYTVRPAKPPKK